MVINIFNHPHKDQVDNQVQEITRRLGTGDVITTVHTPIVLPLCTSNELGGYARSLDFLFRKYIAIDCNRFLTETSPMQEFILSRQVALFDKSNRWLHYPIVGIVVAIAFIASSILFPASSILVVITLATIVSSIVGLVSGAIIAKKERETEKYADVAAFRNCKDGSKAEILQCLRMKEIEEMKQPRSFIKNIFSGYPSYKERLHLILNTFDCSRYQLCKA